jgi:hypothetical protein
MKRWKLETDLGVHARLARVDCSVRGGTTDFTVRAVVPSGG